MNREETRALLERLAGQSAPPFHSVPDDLSVLGSPESDLGYSQLNELLLLFGFDRISHTFFRFLLDGELDYKPGHAFSSVEELVAGVDRFRQLAVLLYGNVKFAFKSFSQNTDHFSAMLRSTDSLSDDAFSSRHQPVFPIVDIASDDAYLTGYLIERELKQKLETNPNDQQSIDLEKRRLEVVKRAKANQDAYLASDHLDVYVATSMRERHEFIAIKRLAIRDLRPSFYC